MSHFSRITRAVAALSGKTPEALKINVKDALLKIAIQCQWIFKLNSRELF